MKDYKKNTLPQVSIIMPCHNGAAYIKDAIISVQNQTFSDWELLIVNDNSSDTSAGHIHGYADSFYHQPRFQADGRTFRIPPHIFRKKSDA